MKTRKIEILIIGVFLSATSLLQAQDSLATVYFYRSYKNAGPAKRYDYDLKHDKKVIGRIKPGMVVTYRSQPGSQIFSGFTESESSIKLIVAAGGKYFVECGLAIGVQVDRPSFRIASELEAVKAIQKIDPNVLSKVSSNGGAGSQLSDTVRALHNLYQRKRKGGTARAIVFGIIGGSSLIGTLNYKPSTITINQGSAGNQTLQVGPSSPPAINYVFIGFSAIMFGSGISQVGKYSIQNLDLLLRSYEKGNPLPEMVKSKLKKKDFK
jgi:hypothetical protein